MFGGFRQRAEETYQLLQAEGTAFLVVAAPEPDALREAAYFTERLAAENMPLAGLILNRVHPVTVPELSAEKALAAAEELDAESADQRLAAGLLRLHAERVRLSARERRLAERFTASQPNVAVAEIPARAGDIHDLEGLREAGDLLAGGG
jgi:anion-transporting  ArsA/GET3 family ATPase